MTTFSNVAPLPQSGAPGHGPHPSAHLDQPRRHPWEIGLLVVVILAGFVTYLLAISAVVGGETDLLAISAVVGGETDLLWLTILATPIALFFRRGLSYGRQRVNGVKMSPTQFPDGYALVAAAAHRFGLSEVPDAYVVLGNGKINAFASGHGFRRYVVVYSDLFEIGGRARDPEALAFIVGHEVGHIAAGHTSFWRQVSQFAMTLIPFLGHSLSRSMEYTADNHGYAFCAAGAQRTIGVLSAGKYLLGQVDFHGMAHRSTTETGFFTWLANMLSSHPVNTWRAASLGNRTTAGALFFRPTQPKLVAPPLSN